MSLRRSVEVLTPSLLVLVLAVLASCERRAVSEGPPAQDIAAAARAADEVAARWYTTLQRLHPSGAPTVAEHDTLAPMLARELSALLARADATRAAARAAAPSEKPPFTDGDLFSSLFEGPTSFAASAAESIAVDTWRVPVALEHAPPERPRRAGPTRCSCAWRRAVPWCATCASAGRGTSPRRAPCWLDCDAI